MDLFTYLGAKNGKFTLPHKSDLFAYLLGKNSKLPVQTASGTTLEITAKKTNILELTLDKMCSQDGTPTPDNPIPVIVAEGYRNYFKGGTWRLTKSSSGYPVANDTASTIVSSDNNNITFTVTGAYGGVESDFIEVHNNETYKITFKGTLPNRFFITQYDTSKTRISTLNTGSSVTTTTFTTTSDGYIAIGFNNTTSSESNFIINDIQIIKGEQELPYVPYGTNYINLNITDGVNTVNKQIPLNDNFIGGIGDYKDVLTIDETGSISLVKNIGKITYAGTENWTMYDNKYLVSPALSDILTSINNLYCNIATYIGFTELSPTTDNRISLRPTTSQFWARLSQFETKDDFKTWLTTHNMYVYYPLATPTTTPLGTIDISLFKGTNIITNSDNCNMTIKYY